MRQAVTHWTPEQIAEHKQWHEGRMSELGYPDKLRLELRRARDRFLMMVTPRQSVEKKKAI